MSQTCYDELYAWDEVNKKSVCHINLLGMLHDVCLIC